MPYPSPIQVDAARANLKGERRSRADNRFWELSGHAFCSCGCKLVSRVTHKRGRRYPYYVCSRYMRDGKEACSHGRWLNADQLEIDVYWALQQVEPQDLEAQIQALIDQERAPESEIEAAHMLLEDVARQREKYQRMAARDLITLEELEQHVGVLNQQRDAAERELERLTSTEERIERLRWIKSNPILTWLHSEQNFEGSRRDYYQNLGLRVVADRGGVEVNGSQIVTPTSTSERSR